MNSLSYGQFLHQIIFTCWNNIFGNKLRCWKPSYLLLAMNSFITCMTISYYICLDHGKEKFIYLHELAITKSSLSNIFFIEKWIVNNGLESLCFDKRRCTLQIRVLVQWLLELGLSLEVGKQLQVKLHDLRSSQPLKPYACTLHLNYVVSCIYYYFLFLVIMFHCLL